jgi:hypothetical protein
VGYIKQRQRDYNYNGEKNKDISKWLRISKRSVAVLNIALENINPKDVKNWFKHDGYEQQ